MPTVMPRAPAPAARPVRRSPSGLETRAAILAAAERHFAERGFEAARLEDIASDVGIRRAAIFYYFKGKQELYAAVLGEVLGGAEDALPRAGSVVERLEASLLQLDRLRGPPAHGRALDPARSRERAARLGLAARARGQPAGREDPCGHRRGRGFG
jgi:AcrR family transcriptional regulator